MAVPPRPLQTSHRFMRTFFLHFGQYRSSVDAIAVASFHFTVQSHIWGLSWVHRDSLIERARIIPSLTVRALEDLIAHTVGTKLGQARVSMKPGVVQRFSWATAIFGPTIRISKVTSRGVVSLTDRATSTLRLSCHQAFVVATPRIGSGLSRAIEPSAM